MTALEKAALALKAKLGEALEAKPLLGDAASGDWYADGGSIECAELVRAVLVAIRDPDEAMKIIIETSRTYFQAFPDSAPETFWGLMIDAILSEKPK